MNCAVVRVGIVVIALGVFASATKDSLINHAVGFCEDRSVIGGTGRSFSDEGLYYFIAVHENAMFEHINTDQDMVRLVAVELDGKTIAAEIPSLGGPALDVKYLSSPIPKNADLLYDLAYGYLSTLLEKNIGRANCYKHVAVVKTAFEAQYANGQSKGKYLGVAFFAHTGDKWYSETSEESFNKSYMGAVKEDITIDEIMEP